MNKQDQKTFVKTFLKSMQDELLDKLNNNQIPEEWDGFELRFWISDKFSHEDISAKMVKESRIYKQRLKDCKSLIINKYL